MRVRLGDLRRVIREEREYAEALQEIFGSNKEKAAGFAGARYLGALQNFLNDLYALNQKLEAVHEMAPGGPPKAVIAGIHSDLFNKIAEFRKHMDQLKGMANSGSSQKKVA